MFELFKAGGPLMWVILVCSLASVSIIIERFWSLKRNQVVPKHLKTQTIELIKSKKLNSDSIKVIRDHSPLGYILAAGLSSAVHGRDAMKESVEDAGRQVVHRLSRFLNTLGTIAAISPLIGLLGTVIGMIKVFTAITVHGVGDPVVLSGGISEALITTAAGLAVGIPTLMFYRYFTGRISSLTLQLEEQAISIVNSTSVSSSS